MEKAADRSTLVEEVLPRSRLLFHQDLRGLLSDWHGVNPSEARTAVAILCPRRIRFDGGLDQALWREVPNAVDAKPFGHCSLVTSMRICEQLLFRREVHPVEARVGDGGRSNTEVNLFRPGRHHQPNELFGRRTSHDRVVNHDDDLALAHMPHGVEFAPDLDVAILLRGGDEGTTDIGVAEEPEVLNARQTHAEALFDVAHGSVSSRVRDWDDDDGCFVLANGRDRMLSRQLPAVLPADLGDVLPVDRGVWPRKVDVLEDALRDTEFLGETKRCEAAILHRALVNDDELAWFHVPHVLGLAQVQRTSLARHNVAVGTLHAPARDAAYAQRPETIWIADGNKGFLSHDYTREGSFGLRHRIEDLVELAAPLAVGDEVEKQFGIDCALQQHAMLLKECPKLVEVGQVAIVREGNISKAVTHAEGLEPLELCLASCRRVPRVPNLGLKGGRVSPSARLL